MMGTELSELNRILYDKQIALALTNDEFAKYLGVSRSWLIDMYSPRLIKKKPIRNLTAFKLINKLSIPMSVIRDYNMFVNSIRKGQ